MNRFPARAPEFSDYDKHTVELVFARCECRDPLTRQFIRVALWGVRVFDYKQQRYGVENIRDSGFGGLITRIQDKVSRVKHLLRAKLSPEEEPIEDSCGDLGVYGVIALMARWGLWPGLPVGGEIVEPDAADETR